MAKDAYSPKLASALRDYSAETQNQVTHLERASEDIGNASPVKICKTMRELIEEAEETLEEELEEEAEFKVRDALIVGRTQSLRMTSLQFTACLVPARQPWALILPRKYHYKSKISAKLLLKKSDQWGAEPTKQDATA